MAASSHHSFAVSTTGHTAVTTDTTRFLWPMLVAIPLCCFSRSLAQRKACGQVTCVKLVIRKCSAQLSRESSICSQSGNKRGSSLCCQGSCACDVACQIPRQQLWKIAYAGQFSRRAISTLQQAAVQLCNPELLNVCDATFPQHV